jgi:hypothetical protein
MLSRAMVLFYENNVDVLKMLLCHSNTRGTHMILREKKKIYIYIISKEKKKKKKTSHIAPDYERRSSLRKRERKLWAMKW